MNSPKRSKPAKYVSQQDELTGILGWCAFHEFLPQSIDNALKSGNNLYLLCANIDNMKHFNLHNGVSIGDEMLKRFTTKVQPALSKHQSFFRYGGDSFAIIGIDSSVETIALLAQQICDDSHSDLAPPQLENCGDKHCLGPTRISISIGIAKYEEDMTSDDFLRSAEKQVKEAKLAGGDCVFINDHKQLRTV